MNNKNFIYFTFLVCVLMILVGCTPSIPSVQYGTIDVNSTPAGARVIVDGVDTGQVTPIILPNIEVGNHTVTLDKFHYKIWQATVAVTENNTSYLNPPLTYALSQVVILQDGPVGKDNDVNSAFPTVNHANSEYGGVGTTSSEIVRYYYQFDLSNIPPKAQVYVAEFYCYQDFTWGSNDVPIGLYNVTSNWTENVMTWNIQPTSENTPIITKLATAGYTGWISWEIDNLVQDWVDGSITNNGLVLKDSDETTAESVIYFFSDDYTGDTSKRPRLVIGYYIP